jgi:hypothetical protein
MPNDANCPTILTLRDMSPDGWFVMGQEILEFTYGPIPCWKTIRSAISNAVLTAGLTGTRTGEANIFHLLDEVFDLEFGNYLDGNYSKVDGVEFGTETDAVRWLLQNKYEEILNLVHWDDAKTTATYLAR